MLMDQKSLPQDEAENVNKEVWVPQGSEVVPAAALINGYTKATGSRFMSSDTPVIDQLLEEEKIDAAQHDVALHLIRLFRSGTSKQGYATMQIFSPSHGYDNSDYCPITLFIRATRGLRPSQMYWIRVLAGVQQTPYANASRNCNAIKDALKLVEQRFKEMYTEDLPEPDIE